MSTKLHLCFSLTAFVAGLKELNPFHEKTNGSVRYWSNEESASETVQQADILFEQRKFLEVYELLNRPKLNSTPEVQWRIGRVLYKLSSTTDGGIVNWKVRKAMMDEANYVLASSLKSDSNNPNIHKWTAVVIQARAAMAGTAALLATYRPIIEHLRVAADLDPEDVVSCYMLGRLCYEMANMTPFQRFVARMLYQKGAPECRYEDALDYLSRAEDAKPRFYLPNLYMLGATCLKLNQPFKARWE